MSILSPVFDPESRAQPREPTHRNETRSPSKWNRFVSDLIIDRPEANFVFDEDNEWIMH